MGWFKKKAKSENTDTSNKDTSNVLKDYHLREFQLTPTIPFEAELQNQKGRLSATDAPYDAIKRTYDTFGLDPNIHYTINDGKLLIGAMAFSEKEALKLLEKQSEAIKKAFNVDLK